MTTYLDCYPCLLCQALSAARIAGASDKQQHQILVETMDQLRSFPADATPLQVVEAIHRLALRVPERCPLPAGQKKRDETGPRASSSFEETETHSTASMRTLILTYPTEIDDEVFLEGKFVQLRWAGCEYLLFAAADELRYHNQLLGRFLSEQGIPHRWEGAEDLVVDHPELTVMGGGRFRLDLRANTLRVWDASSVYGRFDASALSTQLAAADPPWQGLALSVA